MGPTLRALREQVSVGEEEFEIIVIDNGSTDGTAMTARSLLACSPFRARVVEEQRPGQKAAFKAGLALTEAEFIVMVDDDNVLATNFIATALTLFTAHPGVGVIGSYNQAVFPRGVSPPKWFAAIAGKYACGAPAGFSSPREAIAFAAIPGAGCCLRRAPLAAALENGYDFINDTTREGRLWITGMDTEWCYLFSALGWKFLYDPRLRLYHMIDEERLAWSYARKLSRTLGTGVVGIDPFILFGHNPQCSTKAVRATCTWQAIAKLRRLARHGLGVMKLFRPGFEGDRTIIEMEQDLGSLQRIIKEGRAYTAHLRRTHSFLKAHRSNARTLSP